jgi:hypothetical protein
MFCEPYDSRRASGTLAAAHRGPAQLCRMSAQLAGVATRIQRLFRPGLTATEIERGPTLRFKEVLICQEGFGFHAERVMSF